MPETVLRFAGFRLDLAAGRLFRGDEPIALRPKTFATLCALAARPGELVTKDDLLDAVWPGVAVTDDMPRFSVRELRRALGDDPASPHLIETVHGRGYRFIAPVRVGGGRHGGSAAAPSSALATIVVGRDVELATLAAWLAAAERGERTVGFLAGDAGIGKTTLVDALLAEAGRRDDLVIARAECREVIGVDEPYRPLLEALQGLAAGPARDAAVATLRVHAPTWLAQLPSLLAADEEAVLRQRLFGATGERMVREFAGWIDAMSSVAPLLLVLEDLHWSDRATLDALAAVAHGRSPARLLVLATYRPVDAIVANHPLRGLVQELRRKRLGADLTLSVLTRDAVRAYIAARFGTTAADDAALVAFVHDRSDGNPFFMTAVADQLAAAGAIVPDGASAPGGTAVDTLGGLGIPDTLREMIERQLDALEPATLLAVEAGAVVGNEFSAAALAGALGIGDFGAPRAGDGRASGATERDALDDCCNALVRQERLLRRVGGALGDDASPRYAFRHTLYRNVLYQRLAPSRRRRLHQGAGEHLEAHRRNDPAAAAELGSHFERAGDHARACTYLGQAAETAQKRFADREAIAYLERALALLETMPPSEPRTQEELFLRLLLAPSLTVTQGHRSTALAASSARVDALRRDLGDTPGHLFALLNLFQFELMRGRLDAATDLAEHAFEIGASVSPIFVEAGHMATGICRCYRGELAVGRAHLETVADGAVHDSLPAIFDPRIVALSHLADRALVYLGHPDQAVARAEQCLARAAELGHPFSLAVAESTIARMYVVLRDPDRALDLAERALARCAEHGFQDIAHRTSIVRGWARAARGETDDVVDELLPLIETYERAGMVAITSAHVSVVEAAAAAGRLDDALHVLLAAARIVEETGERMEEAEVHRWRGELLLALRGRQAWPEARAWFEKARTVARAQGARWFELRAAVSLARLAADQGQRAAGHAELAAVVATFDEGHGRRDLLDAAALLERLQ